MKTTIDRSFSYLAGCFLVTGTLWAPLPAVAQFSQIQPGSEVEVRFQPGFSGSVNSVAGGTVLASGSSGLTISTNTGDRLLEVQMEDVVYVRVREARRHLAYKTSRIGAIVGAAIGFLGGTFLSEDGLILDGASGRFVAGAAGALIGSVGGFGIGMGVGTAFDRERWTAVEIYHRTPREVASASITLPF
jgi:hypothetical protein